MNQSSGKTPSIQHRTQSENVNGTGSHPFVERMTVYSSRVSVDTRRFNRISTGVILAKLLSACVFGVQGFSLGAKIMLEVMESVEKYTTEL